jgi:hypothetical protein
VINLRKDNQPFVDSNIFDLNVNIFSGPFNIKQLNVIESDSIVFYNFVIKVSIIGASHALFIIDRFSRKLLFTEVIANIDFKHYSNISNSFNLSKFIKKSKSLHISNKLFSSYIIDFSIIPISDIKKNFKLDLTSDIFLSFDFPSSCGSANTTIVLSHDFNNVFVNTLHSYPNNNLALITKSSFIFSDLSF